jgi:hypothetical protein
MMRVRAVTPNIDASAMLAGAQFADAFSIVVDDATLNARHAAERMMGRSPQWVEALLSLRNIVVAPFGLKTSGTSRTAPRDMIGIFPVLNEAPDRLVAGFNDKHLDFRVIVDIATSGDSREVTATTLVLTHNLLGRVYLAVILPFHRLIVPTMLRQVAA